MDAAQLTVALATAGYDRGLLTSMIAERLHALMVAAERGALDGLVDAVSAKDAPRGHEILRSIRGVGPTVAHTAWVLMQ